MAERITGGQCQVYITGANALGTAYLPAGLMTTMDSFDIEPSFTYEDHNEIHDPRTVRQQTDQKIAVTLNGGVTDDTPLHLAAVQSAGFLNKKGTPKYNLRIVGAGSDGSMDRTAKFSTLDSIKVAGPAGNKTLTKAFSWTAEEIV